MMALQVKNAILPAFQLINMTKFTYHESINSGQHLCQTFNQDVDGECAIQRRGCLYLCEEFKVRVVKEIIAVDISW